MRQIIAVIVNDLRVEFADRSTWFSFLILPLLFTLVIGAAMGNMDGSANTDNRMRVAVVNLDPGAQATALLAALANSTIIRTEVVSAEDAQKLFEADELAATLTLPADFSARLLAGEPSDVALQFPASNASSAAVRAEVQTAAAQVSSALLAAQVSVEEAEKIRPFADAAERQAYFDASLAQANAAAAHTPVTLSTAQAPAAERAQIATGFSQSSPGQLVTWTLATLLAGAATLVGERQAGTLRRLLTMPTGKGQILLGKILGRLTQGLLQMAIMVVFGQWVLGVKWGNSPLALAMVAGCFGLAATALGIFFATISRTAQQAGGYGTMGTFLLAPLGGAWFPLEITPPLFQTVSQIFPTHWAMRGFTDVIVRGQGPEGVLLECAVLLGFAVVFFGVGVARFKYE